MWVGGVGVSANNSLCTPNNGFNNVANVTMSWNYILGTYYDTIYGVDTVVTNTGTAGCQPTFGSGHWSGVIATLEASSYYTYTYTYYTTNNSLALAGPAAGSYTLVYGGAIRVNPYPVTVAATSASKIYDGGTVQPGARALPQVC